MYCSKCGEPNAIGDNYCKKCGASISKEPLIDTTKPDSPERPEYYGVKGWLLFFCIALMILGPALVLFSTAYNYSQLSPAFSRYPELKFAAIFSILSNMAVSMFGAYSGWLLWKIKKNAVLTTKIFLIVYGVFSFVHPQIFIYLANLPENIIKILEPDMVKEAVKGVTYSIIWFGFLIKSKRVKATYNA